MNHKEFGFENTQRMLAHAYQKGYAVPALNFISIEQMNAIVDAVIQQQSPVILMVATKHCRQYEYEALVRLAQAGVDRIRTAGRKLPVALHLDHGSCFEDCKAAIDHGFSSVMIDGSALPLSENIRLTKRVADYAHERGVSVEGEVGALSGAEDAQEKEMRGFYSKPEDVAEFALGSGADSIAVSVGTMHGLNKTMSRSDGNVESLRWDLLEEIRRLVPNVPLVLHGCSALEQKYADMNKAYGGDLPEMKGIADRVLSRAAAETAVCKINIASDGWLTELAVTRKELALHPETIDIRGAVSEVRECLRKVYLHKIDMMGSAQQE